MKISQLILDGWADLQRRRDTLLLFRDRLHRAKADAATHYGNTFLQDEVFATHDDLHKRKVLRGLENRFEQQRQAATSVALLGVERPLHAFEPALRAFK